VKNNADAIKSQFRRSASRFYLINLAVLLFLAAMLYLASEYNYYAQAFIPITTLFLIWLFNAGKLLRCPACHQVVRSKEGLIRMPTKCTHCDTSLA
jgi:hypothetical protein